MPKSSSKGRFNFTSPQPIPKGKARLFDFEPTLAGANVNWGMAAGYPSQDFIHTKTKRKKSVVINFKPIKVLICIFCFIILSEIFLNYFLYQSRETLKASINSFLIHTLDFKSIYFIFPNQIVLKDTSLFTEELKNPRKFLDLPDIRLKISILDLVLNGHWAVNSLQFNNPALAAKKDWPLLQYELENLLRLFDKYPKMDMKLFIRKGLVFAGKENGSGDDAVINLQMVTSKDYLSAHGVIQQGKRNYQYSIGGQIKPNSFDLHSFEIKGDELEAKLWGGMKNHEWAIHGYSFLNEKVKSETQEKSAYAQFFNLQHYLIDLDCHFVLSAESLKITQLNFIYDGAPVNARGAVGLLHPFNFNLDVQSFPAYSRQWQNIKSAGLKASGHGGDQLYISELRSNVAFVQDKTQKLPVQDVNILLKDIIFNFREYPVQQLDIKNGKIAFNSNRINLGFDGFRALYDGRQENINSLRFYTKLFDGRLEGDINIDRAPNFQHLHTLISFVDLDLAKADSSVEKLGKLSGQIYFNNYPKPRVIGQLAMKDGVLTDLQFLDWFSKYFDLPSMNSLAFERLSSLVNLTSDGLQFKDIQLKTPDVGLEGYVHLGQDDSVASEFSVTMTRDLMKQSRHLRPLVKRIDPIIDPLQFDFKISGKLDAINFQWVPSELKDEISGIIPQFIQRGIEAKLAGAM